MWYDGNRIKSNYFELELIITKIFFITNHIKKVITENNTMFCFYSMYRNQVAI